MFENRLIGYVYETRFIASWVKAGGELKRARDRRKFKDWLNHLGLTSDQIDHISFLAENGKLELQDDAEKWLKEN